MHHLLLPLRKFCNSASIDALHSPSSSPIESLISRSLIYLCDTPWANVENLAPLHARLVVAGISDDPHLSGRLVRLYALSPSDSSISRAVLYITRISEPTVFSFNVIIKGYLNRSLPFVAIEFFKRQMLGRGVLPNGYTLPLLINASAHRNQIYEGEIFHSIAYKLGFDSVVPVLNALIHMYSNCGLIDVSRKVFDEMPVRDLVSWNSLVDGYMKCGDVALAEGLFWEMPERNVISWNTLISGYVQNQRFKKSLWVFFKMVNHLGERPDDGTLVSVLSACARLQSIGFGKSIHGYLLRNRLLHYRVALDTSLVNFYCKCGLLSNAYTVFGDMVHRDLICWNAMIVGNAEHGRERDAIILFSQMLKEQIKPDDITFIGLLTACSHAGLVEEGLAFFRTMNSDFGIKPKFAHCWCLVDMFSRIGDLDKGLEVIKNMLMDHESSVWGAIFAVARISGETKLGEFIAQRLVELEPHNSSRYAPLLNLYAAAQKWDQYNTVCKRMLDLGLKRLPASTLIDLNNVIHGFKLGDIMQPEMKEIHSVMECLAKKLNILIPAAEDETLRAGKET